MEKNKVVLMFDYLQGPIWISDNQTGEPLTGIEVIDNDKVLPTLNLRCLELYSGCYEFDSDEKPCVFNLKIAQEHKKELLELLGQINARLEQINDGSYCVEDSATKEIEKF